MALRIPWDVEEAVLMLDTFLHSLDGKLTRKEAIHEVSEKLRRRAINKGIEIDEIFRNENGITFQMSAMEVAYTGIKTKLKQPTKLFIETVDLYRNHREDYEKILREAEGMTEPQLVQDGMNQSNVITTLDSKVLSADKDVKQKFNEWMQSAGMAKNTITGYISSFSRCAKFIEDYKLCDKDLWSVTSVSEASSLYGQLSGISEFRNYNKEQHNRFSAAFRKFIEFRADGSKVKSIENEPVLIRYKELLSKFFQKGFRIGSSLDMKRFHKFYQDEYGIELSDKDDLVWRDISSLTILHEGKAYLPDSMLSQEKKEKLIQYIEDTFNSGCNAIYYSAMFSKLEENFQGERIYTPEMLKNYLSYINRGKYVLRRSYIAKDSAVQMNPEDEIREYLKDAGEPVKVKKLSEALSYIPEQKIKFVLSTQSDFIWNTTGVYFHESCFNLSDSELEWISQFLERGIEEQEFVTGNELVEAIEVHFPNIREMYQQITTVGKRNAIAYKLQNRFSFNGNIISKLGENLSMAEVYTKYCQKHSRFTLDELNVLKRELGSTIYFDEIYANSLRISQMEFVSPDMAQFDIEATDEAIERICTGQYMSVQEIRDFGIFPYAGYQWNEFLLEHFVAKYSQKFTLFHICYSASVCAGAIVKRTSSFKNFEEVLIDILVNNDIILDEDTALEYLCQKGYIGRRRYRDIGKILTEAKVVRSKKG